MAKKVFISIFLFIAIFLPIDSLADQDHDFKYISQTAGRMNPFGLAALLHFQYSYRLYDSKEALLDGAQVGMTQTSYISPASAEVGFRFNLQPLSIFRFSIGYQFARFLGAFDTVQSFSDASIDYRESVLDSIEDYTSYGHMVYSEMVFQMRVKKVGFRNTINLTYYDLELHPGDSVMYSASLDMLVPNFGFSLSNNTECLYASESGLSMGLNLSIAHAWYTSDHLLPGVTADEVFTPIIRGGPIFVFRWFEDQTYGFGKPIILVIINWWVRHPYRMGVDVNPWLPYILVGLQFEGSLL
jgi:hypothetical protein